LKKLISIIIPVYNREKLIIETLDSILVQTYNNWECIIVDDGSTDNTIEVINSYCKTDSRIQQYHRPNSKQKGANACRNIGLEKAKGDYVIFFDSDDLMTPNHVEVKVNAIVKHKADYVITRTKFFNNDNSVIDKYYKFDDFKINTYNYISQKINWLTYDVMIMSELAKSIQFNEKLQSGQEYNYFCKLVYKSLNTIFIDEVVTLRRKHEDSIRAKLKTTSELQKGYFYSSWLTYLELKDKTSIKEKEHLLKSCVNYIYEEKKQLASNSNLFTKEIFKTFKLNGIYFLLMLVMIKCFKKGYIFRNKLVKL